MTEKKEFMIKSKILDEQRDRIDSAIELINNSIKTKCPILLRHHSDCDGYASAVNLERVLLKKLRDFHRRESDIYYYYKRSPSRAPFYDYSDALKDITTFLANSERFGRSSPLIIVTDNGSSEQDIIALKRLKQYGAKILIIDHHPYTEEIDSIVDVHINPMMVDGYVYQYSAGMLSAEIAHLLDTEETEVDRKRKILVGALSGVTDKIQGEELNEYLKIAAEEGYGEEKLKQIGNAIDYELNFIGFLESRTVVDDLFFGNVDVMEKVVSLLSPEIEKNRESIRRIVEPKLEIVEKNDFIIGKFNVSKYEIGRGYPTKGMYAGVATKFLAEKYEDKNIIIIAYGNDYMTFRGTKGFSFDLHELIPLLKSKIPYATFGGGGHSLAGTIHFQKGLFDDVFKILDEYLDTLK